MMKLPSDNIVHPATPIYPGSHFTWGEATKDCTRLLQDLVIDRRFILSAVDIEQNIIRVAQKLDLYRAKLGNRPIIVSSWYRPPHVNRSVSGSKFSRHQYGDGIDFFSRYLSPKAIAAKLEADHNKGGYHSYYSFTHVDWRGSKARW